MDFPDDGNPRFVAHASIDHYGTRYHQFSAKLYWTKDRPVYEWCIAQFGQSDAMTNPNTFRWKRSNVNGFLIRDDRDALAFKLRWC